MGLGNYSSEQKANRNNMAENCVETLKELYSKVSEIFTEESFDKVLAQIRKECSTKGSRFCFVGNYSTWFEKDFNSKLETLDGIVDKNQNLKTWWQTVRGNLKTFFTTEQHIDKTKKELNVQRFNQIMKDFNFENSKNRSNLKATLKLSSKVFSPSHFNKKFNGISETSSKAVTALRDWMGFMNQHVLSADIVDES